MTCPNVVDLPGFSVVKGCKKRIQRAGAKNNLQYQSCTPSCYEGDYTQCPWFK